MGLTCAIVEKDEKTKQNKYRCVEIPKESLELFEKGNFTRTKVLTARELKKLLKLLKAKPHNHKKSSHRRNRPRLMQT